MKVETQEVIIQSTRTLRAPSCRLFLLSIAFAFLGLPSSARASLFHGETLDSIANGISWVVLIIGPIIGIAAFWMVHILPEKIAEKKRHPQAKAIQCVCLLSLCFGGILWPLAWLWAYTKPVLHKMAYGTDVGEGHGHGGEEVTEEQKEIENAPSPRRGTRSKNRVRTELRRNGTHTPYPLLGHRLADLL